MERAFQFLKSSDASSRLRCYLQMYIDYEDLVEHLRALQFPIAAPGEMHTHDAKCLSSLAIRQDGTLVLPAEDLAHANLRCLDCCLRHICEPSGQLMWSHETQYIPIGRHARTLLSALSHEPNDATFNADICHLRDSDSGPLPEIWCSLYLASPRRVKLGDYGYVHPDSKHFVCLGNMFDYLQRQAIFTWTESHISSDPLDIGNGYCSWSERRLSHRYTLKSGAFVHTELQKLVADELHGRFWWFHAFEVTMRHDVALQELVLVRATIQHSLVDASESLDIRTTPENCMCSTWSLV
ncbi:hypothetical protein OBBRIDRAFT_220873 [Obba rivulosa]|uniref:Uncharacterized protein n=1 Tax=Obba rivulosa TaxID=1052685 RepID=A0A8E2AW77_9APHY|nr:hypothetical protein OBBRIDRAFT_220873 [Obba rivulosa]